MGLLKLVQIRDYWSTNELLGREHFFRILRLFFFLIQILMHDNIWVAKVAEQVLVQRLHKTKIKRQKQNNNNEKIKNKKIKEENNTQK